MKIRESLRIVVVDKINIVGGKNIVKITADKNNFLGIVKVVLLRKIKCSGYKYSPKLRTSPIKNALSSK